MKVFRRNFFKFWTSNFFYFPNVHQPKAHLLIICQIVFDEINPVFDVLIKTSSFDGEFFRFSVPRPVPAGPSLPSAASSPRPSACCRLQEDKCPSDGSSLNYRSALFKRGLKSAAGDTFHSLRLIVATLKTYFCEGAAASSFPYPPPPHTHTSLCFLGGELNWIRLKRTKEKEFLIGLICMCV